MNTEQDHIATGSKPAQAPQGSTAETGKAEKRPMKNTEGTDSSFIASLGLTHLTPQAS